MKIQKRDGSYKEFDISKIKYMLHWACEGLDVDPLKLESSLTIPLTDGVTTKDIHQNSYTIAMSLTSVEESDWRIVAGRLLVSGEVKDRSIKRGFGYGSMERLIEYMQEKGSYDSNLSFTKEEYEIADSLLDDEYDMIFDDAGAAVLFSRYLIKEELPQEMYMTIAMILAKESIRLGYNTDFAKTLDRFYTKIAKMEVSPATPILLNLRKPTTNLSSCYILQFPDDLKGIYDGIKDVALIGQKGGGVSVNLDLIRAKGSWINGKDNAASGITPLIRVLNDTALYVNQEGVRDGAISPSVSAWHLDVLDFLEIQLEDGEQRKKSFDVFPQLIFNDLFWERVEKGENWVLFDPYEIRTKFGKNLATAIDEDFRRDYLFLEEKFKAGELELSIEVNPRDIVKAHYKAMRVSGMPYITFKDTINRYNPNKDSGVIYGANLCVESFSNFAANDTAHVCNLISVNVANCVKDSWDETKQAIKEAAMDAAVMLDCTISLGKPRTTESIHHNEIYRTIGVGILGMADIMAWYGKSYENEYGIKFGAEITELVALGAVEASIDMAKVTEPYPMYKYSEWAKGNFLGRPFDEFIKYTTYTSEWKALRMKLLANGIRNGQIMAIAPNSSTGVLQGSSPSILPTWKLHWMEATQFGTVQRMPKFVKERPLAYKPYPMVDMDKMIEFVAASQIFVDSGISFELVLDLTNPAKSSRKYWYGLVRKAWKLGVKTLYYTRFITVDGIKELQEGCLGCKG